MRAGHAATRQELHYGDRVVRCFSERWPTIDAMFRSAVARQPERIALVDEHRRMTYRSLASDVERIAAGLSALGVAQGDRVGLLAGNRCEFMVAVLACVRLGAIFVPISTRSARPEVEFLMSQCAAAALIYDVQYADLCPSPKSVPALRHRITMTGDHDLSLDTLGSGLSPAPQVTLEEEDVLCLLYTSGTTGRPKGARLTNLGTIHSVLNYVHGMSLTDGEVSVLAAPASHVTGLIANLFAMVAVASTTVMMPAFKARRFLEIAASERMTHTVMVPAMYNLVLLDSEVDRFDLSAWRIGGFGGAPMPEATIERLASAMPRLTLHNVYGSTETTGPVTMMPPGQIAAHRDTVGRALPGADIVVMDTAGREVATGEEGELWIRGPMVVPGYWNNASADVAAFVDGYWRSGDVGSIDADGFVRILDRRKDVINRGGYKIYSIEVENVLMQHPDVIEAAVVPKPDAVLGQVVHAIVVSARPDLAADSVLRHCAAQLADYKIPTVLTIRAAPLPRNANGKVMKSALAED